MNAARIKLLKDAIDDYKKLDDKSNAEMEIKLPNLTRDNFKTMLKWGLENLGKYEVERSINMVSHNIHNKAKDKSAYIRQKIYDEHLNTVSEKYYRKNRLADINVFDFINYKITLSTEAEIPPFPSQSTALVRARVRLMFVKDDWRYDYTLISEYRYSELAKMNFKSTINKLFTMPDAITIENIDYNKFNKFEIEMEHVGQKDKIDADAFEVVQTLFETVDSNFSGNSKIQEVVYFAAAHIVTNTELIPTFKRDVSLKRLLKQPVTLTKKQYSAIYPPKQKFVTKKLDGNRALIVIKDGKIIIISDKYYEFPTDETSTLIVDAEMISNDNIDNSKIVQKSAMSRPDTKKKVDFSLYIIDVMVFKGEKVFESPFVKRRRLFDQVAGTLNREGSLNVYPKTFIEIGDDTEASIAEVMKTHPEAPDDGLIFNTPEESYDNMTVYKWKPTSKNTIDFLVKRAPQSLVGARPFEVVQGKTLYLLFVGIHINMFNQLGIERIKDYFKIFPEFNYDSIENDPKKGTYFPIQFSPSDSPLAYIYRRDEKDADVGSLDNKVVEMFWTGKNWNEVRVRQDREIETVDYGNNYKIAEMVWQNYINPFELTDLWNLSSSYFVKEKSSIYRAPNGFNSFVKAGIIARANGAHAVVDLASGQGQDIKRYFMNYVRNILFVERDKEALEELIRRKYEISKTYRPLEGAKKNIKGMRFHTLQADLTEKYTILAEKIKEP